MQGKAHRTPEAAWPHAAAAPVAACRPAAKPLHAPAASGSTAPSSQAAPDEGHAASVLCTSYHLNEGSRQAAKGPWAR
jgi:hypothetical protein